MPQTYMQALTYLKDEQVPIDLKLEMIAGRNWQMPLVLNNFTPWIDVANTETKFIAKQRALYLQATRGDISPQEKKALNNITLLKLGFENHRSHIIWDRLQGISKEDAKIQYLNNFVEWLQTNSNLLRKHQFDDHPISVTPKQTPIAQPCR